jgi:large subunit ribosomal protein L25
MKSLTIACKKRESISKQNTKMLRNNLEVPCVIYGGAEPVHFSAPILSFKKLVYTPEVYTVNLDIDGTTYHAIMQDIQFHPVTDVIRHMDFLQLHEDKPVIMDVPVKIKGSSIGVKQGGKLETKVRKLSLKALPKDMPDDIEINIENLKIGKAIRVSDISLANVEILNAPANVITQVKTARTVALEDAPVVAEEETEAVAEEAAAE